MEIGSPTKKHALLDLIFFFGDGDGDVLGFFDGCSTVEPALFDLLLLFGDGDTLRFFDRCSTVRSADESPP